MSRDYDQIQKEIALTGFFSEYLPPCFSLDSKVLTHKQGNKCDLIPPYSFSMSRFNGNDARRTIFIPEIGAYLSAYEYMSRENIIQELIEFSESSTHSFSPILGNQDTIVKHEQIYGLGTDENITFNSEYIKNIGKKIIQSSGAKKILKLDISNCFSSFYMHMMPTIILGVEKTQEQYELYKKNPKDPLIDPQYVRYKKLDEVIRKQNLNRTNGILPGILLSRIIVEALLTRIDKELDKIKINFARYVDDYEVFLYDDNEKKIISDISKVLKKYGFALNFEKTEIIDFPYYIVENFNKILANRFENHISSEELIEIFTFFSNMEKNGVKGSIRFLLKTLEQNAKKIKIEDHSLYKAYLISVMSNNERSLTKVCSILIENCELYPLLESDKEIICKLINNHLISGHDLEVLWLLYLLIKTKNISLGDPIITSILNEENELAYLILLTFNLLDDNQKSIIKQKSNSWIALYELFANDIISKDELENSLGLEKNLSLYQFLKQNGVHFIKDQIN